MQQTDKDKGEDTFKYTGQLRPMRVGQTITGGKQNGSANPD